MQTKIEGTKLIIEIELAGTKPYLSSKGKMMLIEHMPFTSVQTPFGIAKVSCLVGSPVDGQWGVDGRRVQQPAASLVTTPKVA